MKQPCGTSGLITLEMSDEVPSGRQILDHAVLRFPFLDTVFAKMTDACLIRLANSIRRLCLRNGNQGDLFGQAACAPGRRPDALLDVQHIFLHRRRCHSLIPGETGIVARTALQR